MNDPTRQARELASRVFEAMNRRDIDALAPHLAEAAVFDFPGAGRVEGGERIARFLKALLRGYPRLEFSVSDIIADGNRAVAVWTNEGENRSGQPYRNSGVTLVHLAGEKIAFLSDYFKDTSFVKKP